MASMPSRSSGTEQHIMLCGTCPDDHCQTKLYFPSYDASIECPNCGQRHLRNSLKNIEEVKNAEVAIHNMLRTLLVGNVTPKKTADSVKVLGLSNYHCKLLSPLLTRYGMDKQGKAVPLRTLNKGDVFNCAILGTRAFLIQPEHIDIMGYGRDQTGSVRYLKETLEGIYHLNNDQEVLVPIHADGDGHCLVHGISRALVGRELFWHALRTSLKAHFLEKLDIYKAMFHDFVDNAEWDQIIAESDPDFVPGPNEEMGLQNIHIFGLANVLHRPIILLDSLSGLQSAGDYTGVFLPALVEPESCCSPDGSLNKPLCIAWSSSGRNHFIALVGVKGRPLPRLPRWMLTRVWGAPQNLINKYIQFEEDDMCTIGGERSLQDKYIQRLAAAMEEVFQQEYGVHPSVVADVHHFIYKRTGIVGLRQDTIIAATQKAIQERQLFCCLLCGAVSQLMDACNVSLETLRPGGELYELAKEAYQELGEGKIYSFPGGGLQCSYDPVTDELVPDLSQTSVVCTWCKGKELRLIRGDGSIVYHNGDKTSTPAPNTKCSCGFKHYWDGKEFDNMPIMINIPMNWKNESYSEEIAWFQNESDPVMDSNAYRVASKLVQKYFPADFGSETLVKQIVDIILEKTASIAPEYKPPSLQGMPTSSQGQKSPGGSSKQKSASPSTKPKGSSPKRRTENTEKWNSQQASKIIMSGQSTQSLHKEELTLSKTEKETRKRVTDNAPIKQKKSPAKVTPPESPSTSGTGPQQEKPKKSVPSNAERTAPSVKKIRLTTSDGRQLTLSLENTTTYIQLQQKIKDELHIPIAIQTIKYGFPPKELRCPTPEHENDPLPLQHGDRITVEIAQDITGYPSTSASTSGSQSQRQSGVASISSLARSEDSWSAMEEIKRTISRLQESAGDDLEIQLTSQTLVANLKKITFWEHVRTLPSLFDSGGLFYEIVKRDLGLKDGNHCMLPGLKEHRFCYNKSYDRLELCLEPLGHFPISPDVDNLVKLQGISRDHSGLTDQDGTSKGKGSELGTGAKFPGTGQVLAGDDNEMEETDLNSLVGAIGGVTEGTSESADPAAGHRSCQVDSVKSASRLQPTSEFRGEPPPRTLGKGEKKCLPSSGDACAEESPDRTKIGEEMAQDKEEPMDTGEEPRSPVSRVSPPVVMETDTPSDTPPTHSNEDSDKETGQVEKESVEEATGERGTRYKTVKLGPGYTVLMKDDDDDK